MGEKLDKKHALSELKEMILEKPANAPVDEVFAKFCSRHAVSMGTCKAYYDELVAKGEVKKK